MQRGTKIVLGIILGFMFVFMLTIIGLVRMVTRGAPVHVPDHALLEIHLSGDYQDKASSDDLPLPFVGGRGRTVYSITSGLQKARADKRIRGVLLDISGLNVGWGVAQELRDSIKDFRSSGKQVTVFMETAGDKDYYVAAAADKIYMAPQGNLFLNGITMEAQFVKDTLTKVGVEADMHHIGEYKSAIETFTRDTMSDAHREALTALVDSFYSQLLGAISEGRNLKKEEVEAYLDNPALTGAQVSEAHLLDGLKYYDEVLDGLKAGSEDKPKKIDLKDYNRIKPGELGLQTGPKVAVLYVSGEIASGESGRGGMFGGESVGSDTIVEAIQDIKDDDDIKAVILRVDSPGGSALAADIMWRELSLLKDKKPIVVSMSDLAASGGYWIATASDAIVAQPGTLTGSIGAFMGKYNVKGLLDKVGINIETVSRGRYANMFSGLRAFNPDEVKKIDGMLHDLYETFEDRVAKGRHLTIPQVEAVARGRVWTGEQAKERGLVDELGGLPTALKVLKEKAKIDEKANVELVMYPQEGSVIERLLKNFGIETQASMPPELAKVMTLLSPEQRQVEQGPLAIMPFIPTVH